MNLRITLEFYYCVDIIKIIDIHGGYYDVFPQSNALDRCVLQNSAINDAQNSPTNRPHFQFLVIPLPPAIAYNAMH